MKKVFLFLVITLFFASVASAAIPTGDLATDLYAYWDFEDGIDKVSGTHNLTAQGGAYRPEFGRIGDGGNTTIGAVDAYYEIGDSAPGSVFGNDILAANSNWTWAGWFYIDDIVASPPSRGLIVWDKDGTGNDGNSFIVNDTYGMILLDDSGTKYRYSGDSVFWNPDAWNHIVVLKNLTNTCFYFNNQLANCDATYTGQTATGTNFYLADNNGGYNGTIDEVGYWRKVLSASEISALYDLGRTPFLSYPTEFAGENPQNFSIRFSSDQYTLTNYTISIYNSTGLFNQSIRSITGPTNSTNFSIQNMTIGNYEWFVEQCETDGGGNHYCTTSLNETFFWGFQEVGEFYNDPVIETALESFVLNISLVDGSTVQTSALIYNGTSYAATKSNTAGDNWTITSTINIPALLQGDASDVKTFYWNITVSEVATGVTSSGESELTEQTVNELILNFCGVGTATNPVLNFTMVDEVTGVDINGATNATTFQASFQYGLNEDNLAKNFSVDNQSVSTHEFDFCTATSDVIYTDMQSEFSAVGYSENTYILDNATLNSSSTSEITLYVLPEDSSVEFFHTVQQDFINVEDAIVQTAKYFVGSGAFQTVGIHETDATGKFSAWLDLNGAYRYTIIKDGQVLGILERDAICEAAPCEITLALSSDISDPLSGFYSSFAANVLYNLSYDPLAQVVTFEFVDITGLATYFQMDVIDTSLVDGETVISSQLLYTSSGEMTYNATNLTDGEYRVEVFVSRSPPIIIDFLNFIISEFIGTFGTLGLIYAVLIVFTIIFGLSLNPTFLIMAIPLSLSLVKLMGFLAIGNMALTIVYALAIMSIIAMNK